MLILYLIQIFILLYSVILHEIAHAYVAYYYGDSTAFKLGRITFNPLPHLDMLGSIILPFLLFVTGVPFLIGWAKPVPVNPSLFNNPDKGMMMVAIAGPLTNFSLAFIFGVIYHLSKDFFSFSQLLSYSLLFVVQINILLGLFNLIPIPPLDGSRVLYYFISNKLKIVFLKCEPFGFVILFFIIYFIGLDWLIVLTKFIFDYFLMS